MGRRRLTKQLKLITEYIDEFKLQADNPEVSSKNQIVYKNMLNVLVNLRHEMMKETYGDDYI